MLGKSRYRRVNDLNKVIKKRFRVFLVLFLFLILFLILLFLTVGDPYILALTFLNLFRSKNLHLSFLRRKNLDLRLLNLHYYVNFSDHIKSNNYKAKISALREFAF
jgi:hypothetical protein